MLPVGPTGYGDSPYALLSLFGGNPLLISLDALISEGLLRSIDWEESVVIAPELRGSAVSEAAHARSYA